MKPPPPQWPPCDAMEFTARYVRALIGWWSPRAGAPAGRPEETQRDAEQRWEQEGGSLPR